MKLSQLRRLLYRTASKLGDLQTLTSGSPKKWAKRLANKWLAKRLGKFFWK